MLLKCIESFRKWRQEQQDRTLSELSGQIRWFRELKGYFRTPYAPRFPREVHLEQLVNQFRMLSRRYGKCPDQAASQYGI